MARDKNLRPCLPLKPQEKKLRLSNYLICNVVYLSDLGIWLTFANLVQAFKKDIIGEVFLGVVVGKIKFFF